MTSHIPREAESFPVMSNKPLHCMMVPREMNQDWSTFICILKDN